jgi:hypothetical protein
MSTPGTAVPGTVVPSGSLTTPGGAQGVQGIQGPTSVSADANNLATLGSDNLISVPASSIWSVRLRSFNAVQNSTFEVDQRNVNSSVTLPAGTLGAWAQDRWQHTKVAATMALTSQTTMNNGGIFVPGTNFRISQAVQFITLTTAQATLAAGETCYLGQNVEGPLFRELSNDVHSISILASTNVTGGLKFAVGVRDPGATRSFVHLCTLTAPNVWQLITIPNIPVFPAAGNFSTLPGVAGYQFSICYACGTTYTTSANDAWVNMNAVGAIGMDNLGAKPTNSYLAIAFVQHEPGALCTTLQDKPFTQNYDECLRCYQKTYDYGTAIGTVTNNGAKSMISPSAQAFAWGPHSYLKPLAKVPTVTLYNNATGAANSVRDYSGVDHASAAVYAGGQTGIMGIQFTTATAGSGQVYFHYTADTGW